MSTPRRTGRSRIVPRGLAALVVGLLPALPACSGGHAPVAGATPLADGGLPRETGADAAPHAPLSFSSRPLDAPPTYLGTLDDGAACATRYRTAGFGPDAPASGATRHPLFLYFAGTTFLTGDVSSSYTSEASRAVTEAMARRGFVALSVEYDNGPTAWLSDHENQLACLFGAANAESLIAVACTLPGVDCDQGIATWGHSQGALVADLASRTEPRVRAAWTTGYGGDARTGLPRERFRLVNAEGDTSNALVPGLNGTACFTAAECPDDGRKECLRADGSGWILVTKADCQVSSADHCWFDKKTCADGPETLEPTWVDPHSRKSYGLENNADWMAKTAARQ